MTKAEDHELHIYTDGGARGNPGPAGIGVVIERSGEVVEEFGQAIGTTTNNVAEYRALIAALSWVKKTENRGVTKIICYLDSKLVTQQLRGLFKVKSAGLRELFFTAKTLEKELKIPVHYEHIPRAQNAAADAQVNQALDKELGV